MNNNLHGGKNNEHNMDLGEANYLKPDWPRRFSAMGSSWQTEAGHLVCRWAEVGRRAQYNPQWMREASDIQGSYLPPVPDFASHSPFGGPSWFERYTSQRESYGTSI